MASKVGKLNTAKLNNRIGPSKGDIRRRKEKEASAKIRGRKKFDDQSNVDKLYGWIKSGIKSVEAGFPAQTLGGTYTYEEPKK